MKTSKWMLGVLLAISLWSVGAAEAGWQTFRDLTGRQDYWGFTYNGVTYPYTYIDIPENISRLIIRTGQDGRGGYGKLEIYVGYGKLPTQSSYLKRGTGIGYRKTITINNPKKGRYYVRIGALTNFRASYQAKVERGSTSSSLTGTWSGKGTATICVKGACTNKNGSFSLKLIQTGNKVTAKYSYGEFKFSAKGTRKGNKISLKITPFVYREGNLVAKLTGTIKATVSGDKIKGGANTRIIASAADGSKPGLEYNITATFRLTKKKSKALIDEEGGGDFFMALLEELIPQ